MKEKTKVYLFILIVLFILLYLVNTYLVDGVEMTSVIQSLYQITGGLIFVLIMYDVGYKLFRFKKELFISGLIVIIPGLIIGINNFPISAYFNDRFIMTEPHSFIYLFALESFSTAFFEEIIYRGVLLFVVLQKLPNTKEGIFKAIIITSAVFALSHLLNLFTGAGLSNTIMQVGYSFLMGMMWAVVFIKTQNILYSIILHATYNYFGYILFRLGTVYTRFDLVTIIVTVLLAVFAVVYYFYQFKSLDEKEVLQFSNPQSKNN